jgi:iron complex outermembrane receptor protein
MQFENEIAPIGVAIPEAFVQLRKNVPSSYRRGVEIDWNYQLLPTLRFGGNATYMQSRIKEYAPEGADEVYTDVHPIISPEWIINGTLEYNFKNKLQVAISPRYVSESYLEPTNQPDLILPSYLVVDSRITWNFWREHSFSLHLNNIFDEEYYSYGQPVEYEGATVPGYFVQPPFHVYGMLNLRF